LLPHRARCSGRINHLSRVLESQPLTTHPRAVDNVDDGFFCLPALSGGPRLDPVQSTPALDDIVCGDARHRRAVISFLTSEGDRVLGVPLVQLNRTIVTDILT
jgi:hypothetical protein